MHKTEDIINRLAEDNAPVVLRCPKRRSAFWLLCAALLFGAGTYWVGLRHDIFSMLENKLFIVEMFMAIATGILAAIAAHWLSTPDCRQQKWVVWLPFFPLSFVVFILGYQALILPAHWLEEPAHISCVQGGAMLMVVPTIILIVLLKVAVSTRTWMTSFMAVLGVVSFGYVCMRLVCANDSVSHLLFWHYGPAVLFSIVGAILGYRLLKWKSCKE